MTSIIAAFGAAAGLAGAIAPIALTVFVIATSSAFIKKPKEVLLMEEREKGSKDSEAALRSLEAKEEQVQAQVQEDVLMPAAQEPKPPGFMSRLFRRNAKGTAAAAAAAAESAQEVSIEMTEVDREDYEVEEIVEEEQEGAAGDPQGESEALLPPGWVAHVDTDSGDTYYHNIESGETTWDPPTE